MTLPISEEVKVVRAKLGRFVKNDQMPMGVAQRLISDSAWWYGHPHGPARAPKHHERVTSGTYGWKIEFGANYFLVEVAIRRCLTLIGEAADLAEKSGGKVDESDLRERLVMQVRGSVANFNGNEYDGFYDTVKGFMLFGTQAINVNDFVGTICDLTEIHRICI